MKEYEPTEAQKRITQMMSRHPETCKAIAERLPADISRQNVSMQCRIMADNDAIKQHGRGKFSLKPEREASLRHLLGADDAPLEAQPPKKLQKKEREENSFYSFADRFPDHYRWLITASHKGNAFAISILSQLHKGWRLTPKQMACIEKSLAP